MDYRAATAPTREKTPGSRRAANRAPAGPL